MREILNNPALERIPVGFLDDDPGKARTRIHGVPVRALVGASPAAESLATLGYLALAVWAVCDVVRWGKIGGRGS